MSANIILTALSAGMEDAVIAHWLKKEGEDVSKGDALVEIETDKATMELEAEEAGRLGKIYVADGIRASVGQILAVLLQEGEDVSVLPVNPEAATPNVDNFKHSPQETSQNQNTPHASPHNLTTDTVSTYASNRHVKSSPLARRLARQNGIDISQLKGSGPKGRIVKIDVEKAKNRNLSTQTLSHSDFDNMNIPINTIAHNSEKNLIGLGDYTTIPHSTMRQVIARRLMESKTTVPHFYLSRECEMDALLELRHTLNNKSQGQYKITVNDLIIKAVAKALHSVPDANVIWTENAILKLHDIDISVAVAIDGGLITPVVRRANRLSLGAISDEMKTLAIKAKQGQLKPEQYQGGSFSISNLGMYGVDSFSAILNPPQSAILAVGATKKKPIEKNDSIVLGQVMTCTLSFDHRAIDGALGAQLLAAIADGLENPMSLLI